MTVKLGDAGSGEEGLKKLGKRTADEESLDGEGPGGADAADSSSTKRDGQTPRASGAPAPPRGLPTPSPPQGSPQDQHHFLRSSVRPQSKRPRKDAPCALGSGGASGSGPRGKVTVVHHLLETCLGLPLPLLQEARAPPPGT